MGVNANFVADFSRFNTALNDAKVNLADFGQGADRVQTQLNNMVDKFSGRVLIQQSLELTKAIEGIGGAAMLTASEMEQVGNKTNAAVEKLRVMGYDIPPKLQELADATKSVHTENESMLGTLKDVAVAFGLAFSVEGAVRFAEAVLADAKALEILSRQTGINTSDLQVLQQATEEYGVGSDELGRAIYTLSKRIAGGDSSVTAAYAAMGISLDEIKNKNPMDLFLTTERALGQLHGTIQDTAAADLFGGKLGVSMIAFSTNVDETMKRVKDLNHVIDPESVEAAAEAQRAYDDFFRGLRTGATDSIGTTILALQDLRKEAGQRGWFSTLWDDLKAGITTFGGLTDSTSAFTDATRKSIAAANEHAKAIEAGTDASRNKAAAMSDEARAADYMAKLEKSNAVELTDWQLKDLDILKQRGQLDIEHVKYLGITADQLAQYKAGLEAAKKASEELAKQEAEADKIAMDAYTKRIKTLEDVTKANQSAYSLQGQIDNLHQLEAAEEALTKATYDQLTSEKDRMKLIEDFNARQTKLQTDEMALQKKVMDERNKAQVAELEAQGRILAAYGENVDGTVKMQTADEKLARALDDLHKKKQDGISQFYQEQELYAQYIKDVNGATKATNDAAVAADAWNKSLDQLWQDASTGFAVIGKSANDAGDQVDAGMRKGKGGADALKSGIDGVSQALNIMGGTGSTVFPGFTNSIASTLSAFGTFSASEAAYIAAGGFISLPTSGVVHRAGGGPLAAGQPAIVGERGPELFVPGSAGTIMPNGGGGIAVTINVNGSMLTSANDLARAVSGAMMSLLRSQGTRLPVGNQGVTA